MWQQAIQVVMLLLLGIVAWQDLKWRYVSAWVLLLLIALAAASAVLAQGISVWQSSLLNGVILAVQLLVIKLWFSIRSGKMEQLTDKLIGLGDLVFFVVPCIYWGTIGFVLYMLVALLFSLIGALLWQHFSASANAFIPLAGIMSLVLSVYIIFQLAQPQFDRYNDLRIAETIMLW